MQVASRVDDATTSKHDLIYPSSPLCNGSIKTRFILPNVRHSNVLVQFHRERVEQSLDWLATLFCVVKEHITRHIAL